MLSAERPQHQVHCHKRAHSSQRSNETGAQGAVVHAINLHDDQICPSAIIHRPGFYCEATTAGLNSRCSQREWFRPHQFCDKNCFLSIGETLFLSSQHGRVQPPAPPPGAGEQRGWEDREQERFRVLSDQKAGITGGVGAVSPRTNSPFALLTQTKSNTGLRLGRPMVTFVPAESPDQIPVKHEPAPIPHRPVERPVPRGE